MKHAPSTLKHLSIDNCARLTLSVLKLLPKDVSLHSLTFKHCAPSRSIPERVATLTQLTHLDLSGHELTDADIPILTPLTLLKSLDISGSKLSQGSVDQLSALSALTLLDMSWTLAHYPPPLAQLHTLRMDSCEVGGSWAFAYAVHASIHGSEGTLFAEIEELSLNLCRLEAADGGQVGCCLAIDVRVAACIPAFMHARVLTQETEQVVKLPCCGDTETLDTDANPRCFRHATVCDYCPSSQLLPIVNNCCVQSGCNSTHCCHCRGVWALLTSMQQQTKQFEAAG
jgi:hypothetical protein